MGPSALVHPSDSPNCFCVESYLTLLTAQISRVGHAVVCSRAIAANPEL